MLSPRGIDCNKNKSKENKNEKENKRKLSPLSAILTMVVFPFSFPVVVVDNHSKGVYCLKSR